jgi:hypothetical protein
MTAVPTPLTDQLAAAIDAAGPLIAGVREEQWAAATRVRRGAEFRRPGALERKYQGPLQLMPTTCS